MLNYLCDFFNRKLNLIKINAFEFFRNSEIKLWQHAKKNLKCNIKQQHYDFYNQSLILNVIYKGAKKNSQECLTCEELNSRVFENLN